MIGPLYHALRHVAHRSRIAGRIARLVVRAVPDAGVTRDVASLGPFTFGLRRHRWLLGDGAMRSHALNLGMFRRLADDAAVAYDIGGNIGYYACFMARHFPVSKVIAFEPMGDNLRLIRRNAARFGDRMRVIAVALGDTDGVELLQVDDVSDGSAVLDRISGGQPAETRQALGLGSKTERVQVRRLDSLIEELRLPPPGFMKIDTEGAEAIVLAGARETLARHAPHLAIALHGPDKAAAVYALLDPLGYALYGYVGGHGPESWRRLDAAAMADLADNNILASRDGERLRAPIEPLVMDRLPR